MNPLQWSKNVRNLNRLRQIAVVLTQHGFGHIVEAIDLGQYVPIVNKRRKNRDQEPSRSGPMARRIASVFNDLGATYVKLGQMLSTRPDLVPADILRELKKLQSNVPPFETELARNMIHQDLGLPASEIFAEFGPEPFASGSIGQAYRAKTVEGDDVIVKVRRPDVEERVRHDMDLLRWVAEAMERHIPELQIYRPCLIVDEFEQAMSREMDYLYEAAMADRFHREFDDVSFVECPQVLWELTGPNVLTQTFVQGESIDCLLDDTVSQEAGTVPFDKKLIARRLTEIYLKQIFEIGVFHADPHPGNVLVSRPANIGLIDFGQVGVVTDDLATQLVVVTMASVNNEVEILVDALIELDAFGKNTDRRQLVRSLRQVFNKYYGQPLKRIGLNSVFAEISDVIRRHDAMIPRDVVLLIKSLGTVHSIASQLDPELDLVSLLKPRVRKLMIDRLSTKRLARGLGVAGWHLLNVFARVPRQLRQAMQGFSRGEWKLNVEHNNLERLVRDMDKSSNRLAMAIMIAGIVVGSSTVISSTVEFSILGIDLKTLGILGYLGAGVMGMVLIIGILRSGRLG
jgi:ubiquinone biosynthesis protein